MKVWALLAIAAVAAGCGSGEPSAVKFGLNVSPPEEPVAVRAVIPGEHTSFLVSITDAGGNTQAAKLTAVATSASVDRIVPDAIKPGQVAEVWLTIDSTIENDTTGNVTITASRGGRTETATRTLQVMPMSSEGRDRDAQPHFAFWTTWLEKNHPELGITAATKWQPEYVSILLIVSHMSYFSTEWELSLMWHAATIPPNDWSQIYLRRRGSEMTPSLAFKLDSFSNRTAPYAVAPPDVVVR